MSHQTILAKVDYLRGHPELRELDDRGIVRELVKAGLVSAKTYWRDVDPKWLREAAWKETV